MDLKRGTRELTQILCFSFACLITKIEKNYEECMHYIYSLCSFIHFIPYLPFHHQP